MSCRASVTKRSGIYFRTGGFLLKFTLYFCNAILIDFIFDGMYNIINYVGRPQTEGIF